MTDPRHFQPQGLAGAIEFIRLEETLREFAEGEAFVFVPNPGNWGDGLIRYATERFFRANGFRYVSIGLLKAGSSTADELRAAASASKVRVVYGGGGGFLPQYVIPRRFRRMIKRTDRVLVLPSTFPMPVQDLGLRRSDVVFRRDAGASLEFAPGASFCHDMALSIGRIPASSAGSGAGYFFRRDAEKVMEMTIPEGNRDISAEGTESTPMADFLDAIARFETVHTNRLHVSIAAAMMGRQVHLYPNSYFKNRSIYEASLKLAFPNVTFHQEYVASAA